MYRQNNSLGSPYSARALTTLIAGGWGVASAYILFHSLLVTHDVRPCLAALVPLVVVWATLERKRWGRLAMLGLSATALGLFVAALGFAGREFAALPPPEQTPLSYVTAALGLLAERNPVTGLLVVLMAAMTFFWMRRPAVVAEFERGKRATLAVAQKAIAMSLVGCWGITMAFTPLPQPKNRAEKAKHPVAKPQQSRQGKTSRPINANRVTRSAASPNNL